ncbi:MAG: hypothetical protein LBE86_16270 [Gemmobacter sp.]|jgi:chaperonin GroEL (HSP60 family)|nr:hypothetical protein [Gemmobacter sp.]
MRTVSGDGLQREMAAVLAPAMRAIASSLGPEGRHVIFSTGNRVDFARTGSEIARRICPDHYAGRLLKETLVDAERQFGDGTARLAVMAGAALHEAQRAMAGHLAPTHLAAALEDLRPDLDAAFAAEVQPCGPAADLLAAAGLPSDLCHLLAEADAAVGPEGLIRLNEGAKTQMLPVTGFEFEAGFAGTPPLAAMEGIHLIVANELLTDFQKLAPVIEAFATRGKALVIVARGFEGQALPLIERNRRAGVVRMAALLPSDAGPRGAEILADLAAACGASLLCASQGRTIGTFRPTMLGRAERFSFVGGRARLGGIAGDPGEIALRIASAEAAIRANRYLPFDREHAERRRARLLGRWADVTIARGSDSAPLLENARRAVALLRAARAGGVIEGGGVGLERIATRLPRAATAGSAPATAATAMVDAALRAPGRCLRRNAPDSGGAGTGLADPAGLSRDLLEIALSLALQLAGVEGAVLRH